VQFFSNEAAKYIAPSSSISFARLISEINEYIKYIHLKLNNFNAEFFPINFASDTAPVFPIEFANENF
jgi:hypothetical protein